MKGDHSAFCCRLCGEAVSPSSWGGGECSACGSLSATTLPSEAELAEYYRGFNRDYQGGHAGGGNLIRYARRYLRLLQRHATGGSLIDVGSSTSPFPNLAAGAGFEVTVLDYVRPKQLDPGVRFTPGNLNDLRLLDGHPEPYHVVSAWAVLEHVPNPALACRLLAELCRPGGVVCLSTPETGTPLTRHSLGRSPWFCPPMHLHLLSVQALAALFARHHCRLLEWGRLELNAWRYAGRYGIGVAEAVAGAALKAVSPGAWARLRDSATHRFQGIVYLVLEKGDRGDLSTGGQR